MLSRKGFPVTASLRTHCMAWQEGAASEGSSIFPAQQQPSLALAVSGMSRRAADRGPHTAPPSSSSSRPGASHSAEEQQEAWGHVPPSALGEEAAPVPATRCPRQWHSGSGCTGRRSPPAPTHTHTQNPSSHPNSSGMACACAHLLQALVCTRGVSQSKASHFSTPSRRGPKWSQCPHQEHPKIGLQLRTAPSSARMQLQDTGEKGTAPGGKAEKGASAKAVHWQRPLHRIGRATA